MIHTLLISLCITALLLFFIWALASYMMHFSMLRGDRKGKDDPKPKYISFQELMRKFNYYKEDLSTDPEFPGFIAWKPRGENLRSLFLIGMEITPIEEWSDKVYGHLLAEESRKFYWHASILRVDGNLRWLDPIGFFLLFLFSHFFAKLPNELSFYESQIIWRDAQRIFEEKHQDLVKEYNEKFEKNS